MITTPEGFAINTGNAIEDFSNKVLKIMEDAQGNYKVLVQGVDISFAKLVDKPDGAVLQTVLTNTCISLIV